MSKMTATCCSPICTGVPNHQLNKKHFVIIEDAKGSMCPHCGYALRWVKSISEKYKAVSNRSVDTKKQKDYGLNQQP